MVKLLHCTSANVIFWVTVKVLVAVTMQSEHPEAVLAAAVKASGLGASFALGIDAETV